jgi:hypothetical protein
MTEEFKAGKIEAYQEMQNYATSMISTTGGDPTIEGGPWLDMSFFAWAGIDELENGLPEGLIEMDSAA